LSDFGAQPSWGNGKTKVGLRRAEPTIRRHEVDGGLAPISLKKSGLK
jgi:hypothetical protein